MATIKQSLEFTQTISDWQSDSILIHHYDANDLVGRLIKGGVPIDVDTSTKTMGYSVISKDSTKYFRKAVIPLKMDFPNEYNQSLNGLNLRTGKIIKDHQNFGELEITLGEYQGKPSEQFRDPMLIPMGPSVRKLGIIGTISFEGDVVYGAALVAKAEKILGEYHILGVKKPKQNIANILNEDP